MHFPPKQFFSKKRQLHPIIWIKSITENWKLKIFMHFFTCLKPFKVLLYNALCEMELPRKFEFFPIFHYKTILFSSESEFSMKNVFFWGTSCWCSSKIREIGRGNHKVQLQLMSPPFNFLNFWAISTWCISKEHIFHRKFRFRRKKYSFLMKNLKKIEFS